MNSLRKSAIAIAAALPLLFLAGCEKTDPTAPENSTLDLSANPASVDLRTQTSGTSTITAVVLDSDGRSVSGVNVRFSTNSGSLRSAGNAIKTDSRGVARDILTLQQGDDDATVRARAAGTAEKTVTVAVVDPTTNAPPVAVPRASSSSVKTGQDVTFNGTDSSDPDGTVQLWKWTFNFPLAGGGSTSEIVQGDRAAASIVTRSFPAPGTVVVRLQVTDDRGALSTIVTLQPDITVVSNFPPTAIISGPTSVTVNTPLTLDGSASRDDPRDVGGAIVRYDWTWGDGTADLNLTTPSASHTYTTTGSKTVTLKVYDNGDGTNCSPTTNLCNDSNSATANITVTVN